MHDNWLVAIALCVAGLGITVLMFTLMFYELPEDSIDAADGMPLRLRGNVTGVQERGNMTIITITQPTTIDVVLFEPVNASGCILVQGKKSTYRGDPQIAATKITRCA